MRLLCTGDLHIGRRPTRLPEGLDGARFSAAAMWERVVDCALEQRVDVVALTGDVVDRDNRFAEAFGPLERGLRRLTAAGIETVAVAGNHDFDVLPGLAASLKDARLILLGEGGRWERHAIVRDGKPVAYLDGWSFPTQHVHSSPLRDYALSRPVDVPVVGVLHADVDQPSSRYAPAGAAELQSRPVAAWLLGHIHVPGVRGDPNGPPLLYPGSPQGLSPDETGPHGPWLVEVAAAGRVSCTHIPLAPLRYERVVVAVDGIATAEVLNGRLAAAVRERGEAVAAEGFGVEHVRCRLQLTGATSLHGAVAGIAADICRDLEVPAGSVTATVEKMADETRPDRDLAALARGGVGDPAVVLARLLTALGGETPLPAAYASAVSRAQQRLAELDDSPGYHELRAAAGVSAGPAERAARDMLLRQGWLLLDALLVQKERES